MAKHIYLCEELARAHKAAVRMHKRISKASIPPAYAKFKARFLSDLYNACRHIESADKSKGDRRKCHMQSATALMQFVNDTINSLPVLKEIIKNGNASQELPNACLDSLVVETPRPRSSDLSEVLAQHRAMRGSGV